MALAYAPRPRAVAFVVTAGTPEPTPDPRIEALASMKWEDGGFSDWHFTDGEPEMVLAVADAVDPARVELVAARLALDDVAQLPYKQQWHSVDELLADIVRICQSVGRAALGVVGNPTPAWTENELAEVKRETVELADQLKPIWPVADTETPTND